MNALVFEAFRFVPLLRYLVLVTLISGWYFVARSCVEERGLVTADLLNSARGR
jgi:hypothetical protein